jgi:hypothetical protein
MDPLESSKSSESSQADFLIVAKVALVCPLPLSELAATLRMNQQNSKSVARSRVAHRYSPHPRARLQEETVIGICGLYIHIRPSANRFYGAKIVKSTLKEAMLFVSTTSEASTKSDTRFSGNLTYSLEVAGCCYCCFLGFRPANQVLVQLEYHPQLSI